MNNEAATAATSAAANANVPLSIHKITDLIVDGQLKDIRLYTKGHLNEANLWKPPEPKHHTTWESANKGHILTRPAYVHNKRVIDENLVNSMCDTLADLTVGTTVSFDKRQQQQQQQQSPILDSKKGIYIEELKLPNIIVAKKQATPTTPQLTSQTPGYLGGGGYGLPKLSMSLNIEDSLPKSDIEIAYKIIDGPFNGATKQEKYKNFKKFEANVIQKSDLSASNVLYETAEMRRLEDKLNELLTKTGLGNNQNASFHRLQIYGSIFDEIILEKNIFGDLLRDIKKEYDLYLNHLLDKQPNSGSQLFHQAEYAEQNGINRKNEIKLADEENERLEELVRRLYAKQENLNRQIEDEVKFHNEKFDEINKKIHHSYAENITKLVTIRKNEQPQTIADKIDLTREQIMNRIKDLTEINETLNKDYVPNSVINNLLQSIKDTEIESEKLLKQNEFLDDELKKSEELLIGALLKYDNTEFAKDNVEYLMKTLKSLEVIQLQEEEEKKEAEDNTATLANTDNKEGKTDTNILTVEDEKLLKQNENEVKKEQLIVDDNKSDKSSNKSMKRNGKFLNKYDDYFS